MVDAPTATLALVSLACEFFGCLARLANILARAQNVPLAEAVVPDHFRQDLTLALCCMNDFLVLFNYGLGAERLVFFLFLLVDEDIAHFLLVAAHDLCGILVKKHVSLTLIDVVRVLSCDARALSLRIDRSMLVYPLRSQLLLARRPLIYDELLPVEYRGLIQQHLIDLWTDQSLIHALAQDLHALDLLC